MNYNGKRKQHFNTEKKTMDLLEVVQEQADRKDVRKDRRSRKAEARKAKAEAKRNRQTKWR
jgi:hypothetical protein